MVLIAKIRSILSHWLAELAAPSIRRAAFDWRHDWTARRYAGIRYGGRRAGRVMASRFAPLMCAAAGNTVPRYLRSSKATASAEPSVGSVGHLEPNPFRVGLLEIKNFLRIFIILSRSADSLEQSSVHRPSLRFRVEVVSGGSTVSKLLHFHKTVDFQGLFNWIQSMGGALLESEIDEMSVW